MLGVTESGIDDGIMVSARPTWLAPSNSSASEQTCTISVVGSDGFGVEHTSSYQQRVSPGGAASLAIVGGIQFLQPPPCANNSKTTVDATIKNVGTTPRGAILVPPP